MKVFILLILLSSFLVARDIPNISLETLTQELNLTAGAKASIQWKRIFSSQRHLVRYNLDHLSQTTLDRLQVYLIDHAADSEQPIVPGL